MSDKKAQKSSVLLTKVHFAYIREYSNGIPATEILFSVRDSDSMAWYTFTEHSKRISQAASIDFHRGKGDQQDVTDFGGRMPSKRFEPSKPLRVDELVNWNSEHDVYSSVEAHLSSKPAKLRHLGNIISMELTLHLKSGDERVPLEAKSLNSPDLPARFESGFVDLLGREAFTVAHDRDYLRFRADRGNGEKGGIDWSKSVWSE